MQLKAQVLYKLASYQEAVDAYEKVYNSKCYDESEIGDIITNLLACSANQFDQIDRVNVLIEKLAMGADFEKTYEFYFNQS